jgi:hypothetical protein
MKIGMIFECGPKGADPKVYEYLAKQLQPDIEISPFFLDNKPKLIGECGKTAKALLELDGCERVLILWDLCPPWKEKRAQACRRNDCNLIHESLTNAGLTSRQLQCIHLICIEKELETLLLADEQAISAYLTKLREPTRGLCKVKRIKDPESHYNPKDVLYRIFQTNGCQKYEDLKDAEKMIKLVEIEKLKVCSSFVRFEMKIRL